MNKTTRNLLIFMSTLFVTLTLCVAVVRAQDLPQPKPITDMSYYLAKIHVLETELGQAVGYVNELRTKLDEANKEITSLKEKVKKHEK